MWSGSAAAGESGRLVDYLQKDGRTNLSKVVASQQKDAKKAVLDWRLEAVYDGYALAEIELQTGRHHQIRVQMSHAGMPLLGDSKYGTAQSLQLSEQLGLRHTALLADRLLFSHPATGEGLQFSLPFPKEWKINIQNI